MEIETSKEVELRRIECGMIRLPSQWDDHLVKGHDLPAFVPNRPSFFDHFERGRDVEKMARVRLGGNWIRVG